MIPIDKTQSLSLTDSDSNLASKSEENVRNIDRLVLSLKDNNGNRVYMNINSGNRKPELWSFEITCVAEKK